MDRIYAGLDVSDKATHICVVTSAGEMAWPASLASSCPTSPVM